MDFTIAASGGDITGSALGALLNANNVEVHTAAGADTAIDRYGTVGTAGNINVNDNVAWSTNTLTLTASNDININGVMTATNASLVLAPTSGKVNVGLSSSGFTGRVDFFQANGSPRAGAGFLTIGGAGYTVITALGVFADATGGVNQTLQGMARAANLAGKFARGSDIDASATSGSDWLGFFNYFQGFLPVGTDVAVPGTSFTGVFDGLGHAVRNITINRPMYSRGTGLFGYLATPATVRNVGMAGGSITGMQYVGGLVGYSNHGAVSNAYASLPVAGPAGYVGGLVGWNDHTSITIAYATGNVTSTGGDEVGGLVGHDDTGTYSKVYATGIVNGRQYVGGLLGTTMSATSINNAYATGDVTSSWQVAGGLVGLEQPLATITNTYATGTVTAATGGTFGGLVGSKTGGSVTNSLYD